MPNSSVELDIDASPGSMGSPVKLGRLEGEERRRASDGWRLHAFNEWGADFTFTFLPSMSKRYLLWLSQFSEVSDREFLSPHQVCLQQDPTDPKPSIGSASKLHHNLSLFASCLTHYCFPQWGLVSFLPYKTNKLFLEQSCAGQHC